MSSTELADLAPPGAGHVLDDERPSIVVNARTESLEILHATGRWVAAFGEPCSSFGHLLGRKLFQRVDAEMKDLLVIADSGRWSATSSRSLVKHLRLLKSDGSVYKAALGVTLPSPDYARKGQYLARITILRSTKVRSAPLTEAHGAMAAIPEHAPMLAPAKPSQVHNDMLHVDFATRIDTVIAL